MAIPRDKTELTTILEYGVDQKNRIVYFGPPLSSFDGDNQIRFNSIELTIRAINTMILDAPNKPISIFMNSYGGEVNSMLYLMDLIETSPCQFKFYGGGSIMSAATLIMAVCDERNLYPNTTIMVHKGSNSIEGNSDDIYIATEEDKRLSQEMIKIYSQNSFMKNDFWSDVLQRDLFLNANEAIQLGLADQIVKPKKRGNLRKKRAAHLSTPPNSKSIRNLIKKIYSRIGFNNEMLEIVVSLPPKDEVDETIIVDNVPLETIENVKETKNETK